MSRQNRVKTFGWNAHTRSPAIHNETQNYRKGIRRAIRTLRRAKANLYAGRRALTRTHLDLTRFMSTHDGNSNAD